MFIIALFVLAPNWKHPQIHHSRMDKYIVVCSYSGLLFHSENKLTTACDKVLNFRNVMLSERSQTFKKYR